MYMQRYPFSRELSGPIPFSRFFCVCGCPFSRMLETQIFSHLDGLMLGDVLLLQWVFDPGDDPPILGAHLLCHLYNQEFVLIFGKPASQIRPFRFLGICLIFFCQGILSVSSTFFKVSFLPTFLKAGFLNTSFFKDILADGFFKTPMAPFKPPCTSAEACGWKLPLFFFHNLGGLAPFCGLAKTLGKPSESRETSLTLAFNDLAFGTMALSTASFFKGLSTFFKVPFFFFKVPFCTFFKVLFFLPVSNFVMVQRSIMFLLFFNVFSVLLVFHCQFVICVKYVVFYFWSIGCVHFFHFCSFLSFFSFCCIFSVYFILFYFPIFFSAKTQLV